MTAITTYAPDDTTLGPKPRAILEARGFTPFQTGGGCMALVKVAGGTYEILVTDDGGSDIPEEGERALVGAYYTGHDDMDEVFLEEIGPFHRENVMPALFRAYLAIINHRAKHKTRLSQVRNDLDRFVQLRCREEGINIHDSDADWGGVFGMFLDTTDERLEDAEAEDLFKKAVEYGQKIADHRRPTAAALDFAIDQIEGSFEGLDHPEAKRHLDALRRLRDQRGCEDLDPACEDGRLTTLCDIAIYG